jgi:uncharacterized protein (TIGR02246 family)
MRETSSEPCAGAREEAEVRALVQEWARAVRRKDRAGILRRHSPDVLMFDVPPPLQSRGMDAYARTWDVFFEWSDDPVRFDILDMHVTAGRDVAFVAAILRCAGTDRGAVRAELEFRLTIGLEKVDGEWIVTHEHHSIPAGA